jgi:hypothetical protein
MYYDLGVYGIPKQLQDGGDAALQFKPVSSMRTMEDFTRKHSGAPFLYGKYIHFPHFPGTTSF